MKKRILSAILSVLMFAAILAGCSNVPEAAKIEQGDYTNSPALVLGATQFNGVFSPFFGTTGYDMDIASLVHATILGYDRASSPDSTGLCEYQPPVENKDDNGDIIETIYTFKLKDGVVFSDGTPVTADDIMFSYLVFCDPFYDGASTIYTTPIRGVNEYRYDDPDYSTKVKAIEDAAANYTPTADEIDATATELAEAYKDYGVTKEDLLEGGVYYEDETLASIRSEKETADKKDYVTQNLSGGAKVAEIEGIKKVDNRTVTVTLDGIDPKAIYSIGAIQVVPKAYYGEGYEKGKLEGVRAKNATPMGAGPYRFVSYQDNVVSLVANDRYYKGSPLLKKIKYQVTTTANKLEGVKLGEFDISDPTASPAEIQKVEAEANIHYELIDNLGYGYIGISANRIKDKNIRKGIMHLMNREPAVAAYYGNLASVIERPISRVSWAYPKDATEYYGFDSAKALQYFEDAGYVLENGKLMKGGKQLTFEIAVSGDGKGDHPSYPIILGVKNEGAKIGVNVIINDYTDGDQFFVDMESDKLDVWCAAWQATPDPDLYQTYHSDGPSNHYKIKDDALDKLIMDGIKTSDIEERKQIYSNALDIIMDWAVEMPVYQRKNMYIFNSDIVNIESLPADMTPYYGYFAEVEKFELVTK